MIGLARLAWKLAQKRCYPWSKPESLEDFTMTPRKYAHGDWPRCSKEYYRIIDRISRGEKP